MDLYWIYGSVAVATRPRGGEWLDDELSALHERGVDVLVSCLLPMEEEELGLIDEEGAAARAGIDFARLPIPDGGVPPDLVGFDKKLDALMGHQRAGRRIAVHCRQGLGRSPLAAAALLIRSGMLPDDAWRLIARARGTRVPETDEQRQWIERFAERTWRTSTQPSSAAAPQASG